MTTVEVPHSERAKAGLKWLAAACAVAGFAYLLIDERSLPDKWLIPTIGFVIFSLPAAYRYFQRQRREMTVDALKSKSFFLAQTTAAKSGKNAQDPWIETVLVKAYEATFVRVLGRTGSRYLIAAAAFIGAAYLAFEAHGKDAWVWPVLLAGFGCWMAREAVLWLIGGLAVIAVVSWITSGIAALPVSVAVIIGALIIASAVQK